MKKSAEIYKVYLSFVSPDDIHVYSIDECFIDLTPYMKLYRVGWRELVERMTDAVFDKTGITAAAGVGTNLFLAKVALDISAKHSVDGLAFLDEESFSRTVAHHRPITDIWNIGHGTARRLAHMGVYDLAGVADMPEDTLYREFGVNAEYLIDHAHGREACTIADIKRYKPSATSLNNSQVLFSPYSYEDALIILCEMVEAGTLELVERHLATDRISLSVGYEHKGRVGTPEWYEHPHTGGSRRLSECTNSLKHLTEYFKELYASTTDPHVPIRNISISFGNLLDESYVSVDMFTDVDELDREHALLGAMVEIKSKYGKNAIVKGLSFEKKATARARNLMVGGHNGE